MRPSGFARALATFARLLVVATPTVIGRPASSRMSRRSRKAISVGVPTLRAIPRTSRNASSIDIPSTTGEVRSKIAKTARLASTYASHRGCTTTASGHSRRARAPPMPPETPWARAS